MDISIQECSKALNSFQTLVGHMEVLQDGKSKVIMDFAHNTDSLEKSLIEIKNLVGKSKSISLFGSAGLRDVAKRYDMGVVAGKFCNIVIVVPEDPRTESLYEINSEILRGCEESGLKLIKRFSSHEEYLKEKNTLMNTKEGVFVFDYDEIQARIDGIEIGINLLEDGDILITQGKGHEQSMCFGKTEFPYDEKKIINKLLNSKE